MKYSEMSLVELRQRRASIIDALQEANGDKDFSEDAKRIVVRGYEAELADLRVAIDQREGRNAEEAAEARRRDRGRNGQQSAEYEIGTALRPDQSFRSYMQDNGLIKQPEFEGLRLGSVMRAMVLGPKTDLERRALSEGSDSAGGVSVPDVTLARFIDSLRAAQVCVQAGAQTVPLTTDKTTIARTVSDPVFAGVTLTARSLAVIFKASRELIEDSLNIERALEASLRGAFAVELDRVALLGSGTPPEPRGIFNTVGVNSLPGIALVNYDPFIQAMAMCWADNSPNVTGVVLSPTNMGITMQFKESTTNAYMQKPAGLPPFYMTSSMDDDSAVLGDFTRLIIGIRTQLRIEVLRELYAANLQYGFVAYLRADIGVEAPQAFARITNLTSS